MVPGMRNLEEPSRCHIEDICLIISSVYRTLRKKNTRFVVVMRELKDTLVSYYHFYKWVEIINTLYSPVCLSVCLPACMSVCLYELISHEIGVY